MKKIWLASIILSGCFEVPPDPHQGQKQIKVCDKDGRERVFLTCLERIPNGPVNLTASGNDWAEVVEECKDASEDINCKYEWVKE